MLIKWPINTKVRVVIGVCMKTGTDVSVRLCINSGRMFGVSDVIHVQRE